MKMSKEVGLNQNADPKEKLRVELEATRQEFHLLLEEIPAEMLDRLSLNPAWTIRDVLYHMSLAPRNLPSDVRLIRHLKWVPKLPPGLFNRLNAYLTRRGARYLDKAALPEKYDQAHARTLQSLESFTDGEWQVGVDYPDWDPMLSGYVNLERLFHYGSMHFKAHVQGIREVIS